MEEEERQSTNDIENLRNGEKSVNGLKRRRRRRLDLTSHNALQHEPGRIVSWRERVKVSGSCPGRDDGMDDRHDDTADPPIRAVKSRALRAVTLTRDLSTALAQFVSSHGDCRLATRSVCLNSLGDGKRLVCTLTKRQ
ncbi:hypothetical protein F2P81_020604 [Scophthalmus maximus]|uniref:Uncharacterized protein n=1 Tax=Scophthalmus maximus TaxID=52904 RepID=A0A6A4S0F9_SCOMX|nr:hypothetical protein F2P81_020604 [Scophthalmus maximus]